MRVAHAQSSAAGMLVCEQAALWRGVQINVSPRSSTRLDVATRGRKTKSLAACAVQVNLMMISTTDQSQNGLVFQREQAADLRAPVTVAKKTLRTRKESEHLICSESLRPSLIRDHK